LSAFLFHATARRVHEPRVELLARGEERALVVDLDRVSRIREDGALRRDVRAIDLELRGSLGLLGERECSECEGRDDAKELHDYDSADGVWLGERQV
jgi:hypothetical protein